MFNWVNWFQGMAVTAALVQAEPSAEVTFIAPKTVSAGAPSQICLEATPRESFHLYYMNPGETGKPMSLEWEGVPEGITIGELQFPIPHRIPTGSLHTNGYEEVTRFFSSVSVDSSVKPGAYPITAKASWLACDDEKCVLGKKVLQLDLQVVDATEEASEVSFEKSLQLIPLPVGSDWQTKISKNENEWSISLIAPEGWEVPEEKTLDVFSETVDLFEPGAVPKIESSEGQLIVQVPASKYSKDLSEARIVLVGPTPPLRFSISLPK